MPISFILKKKKKKKIYTELRSHTYIENLIEKLVLFLLISIIRRLQKIKKIKMFLLVVRKIIFYLAILFLEFNRNVADCSSCAGRKSSQERSFECARVAGGSSRGGRTSSIECLSNEGQPRSDGVNRSKIRGTLASSKIFGKSCLYKKGGNGGKLPLKWPLPGGYALAEGCNQNF